MIIDNNMLNALDTFARHVGSCGEGPVWPYYRDNGRLCEKTNCEVCFFDLPELDVDEAHCNVLDDTKEQFSRDYDLVDRKDLKYLAWLVLPVYSIILALCGEDNPRARNFDYKPSMFINRILDELPSGHKIERMEGDTWVSINGHGVMTKSSG